MTLEVVIARRADGVLLAWVLQEGRAGAKNLLRGRSLTNVDSAKMAIGCGMI